MIVTRYLSRISGDISLCALLHTRLPLYFTSEMLIAFFSQQHATGCNINASRMTVYRNCLVDEIQTLRVGCNVWRKPSLIPHIRGILAILLLDDALEGMIDLDEFRVHEYCLGSQTEKRQSVRAYRDQDLPVYMISW